MEGELDKRATFQTYAPPFADLFISTPKASVANAAAKTTPLREKEKTTREHCPTLVPVLGFLGLWRGDCLGQSRRGSGCFCGQSSSLFGCDGGGPVPGFSGSSCVKGKPCLGVGCWFVRFLASGERRRRGTSRGGTGERMRDTWKKYGAVHSRSRNCCCFSFQRRELG